MLINVLKYVNNEYVSNAHILTVAKDKHIYLRCCHACGILRVATLWLLKHMGAHAPEHVFINMLLDDWAWKRRGAICSFEIVFVFDVHGSKRVGKVANFSFVFKFFIGRALGQPPVLEPPNIHRPKQDPSLRQRVFLFTPS